MALDDTQVFLPELWASHARFRADKTALVCGADRLSCHFHDTRGMGVANAAAALDAGIRRFDGAIGWPMHCSRPVRAGLRKSRC